MSALEREIMEKFRQLHPAAKQRIRALIEQETAAAVGQTEASTFDYDAGFRDIETLRQQVRGSQSNQASAGDVVGMLRDLRDGEDE